jgi:hypothetical protein
VDLNYILPFGKYKGKTLNEVIKINPQYIPFCRNKLEWFDDKIKQLSLANKTIIAKAVYAQEEDRICRTEGDIWGDSPDDSAREDYESQMFGGEYFYNGSD